jgi:DNA-binding MarR family transcriptional regulator
MTIDHSGAVAKLTKNKRFGNSPKDIAEWFCQRSPETDKLSVQAHVLLNRVYMQISAKNEVGKESHYTSGRFNVLRLLDRAGEQGLLMTEIAASLSISITNLPRLMDDLVARKLIVRVRDQADGRKRWAQLTPQGRKVLEEEVPRAGRSISKAWESLGKGEKQQLIDLLGQLVEDFQDQTNRHWT